MNFLVNPATVFILFAIAIIFFRKDQISLGETLMFFFRRASLNFKQKLSDVFKIQGILLLIFGSLIAFLAVAL